MADSKRFDWAAGGLGDLGGEGESDKAPAPGTLAALVKELADGLPEDCGNPECPVHGKPKDPENRALAAVARLKLADVMLAGAMHNMITKAKTLTKALPEASPARRQVEAMITKYEAMLMVLAAS